MVRRTFCIDSYFFVSNFNLKLKFPVAKLQLKVEVSKISQTVGESMLLDAIKSLRLCRGRETS